MFGTVEPMFSSAELMFSSAELIFNTAEHRFLRSLKLLFLGISDNIKKSVSFLG